MLVCGYCEREILYVKRAAGAWYVHVHSGNHLCDEQPTEVTVDPFTRKRYTRVHDCNTNHKEIET